MVADWLPSLVVAAAAIGLIVWLVERVAPGSFQAWLAGSPLPIPPRRTVSRQRRLMTLIALVLALVVLVSVLYYVFSPE
jgi:hypothetical protein